ncbi:hypothetical protein [Spirosoma radiotolerans]|uniref:Lipoprotein n=1 Tax=Spirosoma radiotolerans TaxID=1379870 RepID=A0A0E3ZUI3_9BACT|nr:hypothetical protein [Spirosoma radiotolerans]AKD54563.1 hypothetical protein SD10_06210 [Spirosoma radiotolerans]
MRKRSRFYNVLILAGLLGIVGGCQTNNDPVPDDSAYYPLQTGDYWVYQVTEETYSLTNGATTQAYQLQQKISNSFTRNGQLFFQLEESTRQSAQNDWQISATRTVYKSLSEVVSQDNNVPTINLLFPISATTSWNINTYNGLSDTVALQYQNIGRPFATGKLSFDRTVSVVGPNDSTLINLTKYQRVYAQNVGLVYRENTALAYCQSTPDCIGKGKIDSGTRQKWTLITSSRVP